MAGAEAGGYVYGVVIPWGGEKKNAHIMRGVIFVMVFVVAGLRPCRFCSIGSSFQSGRHGGRPLRLRCGVTVGWWEDGLRSGRALPLPCFYPLAAHFNEASGYGAGTAEWLSVESLRSIILYK